jgi:hypothetical protein
LSKVLQCAIMHDMSLAAQSDVDVEYNRRTGKRFPIRQEVKYKVTQRQIVTSGSGVTLNIASRGLLFTTQHHLAVGQAVEVSVSWPVSLSEKCALKLVARGRVMRAEGGRAAMRIESHEFRTRAALAS